MSGTGRRLAAVATTALLVAAAACQHGAEPTVAPANPLADSADQVMFRISTLVTDQGLLRAKLEADTAFFFGGNSRIVVENEHVTFYTTTGAQSAVLTARHGTYDYTRSAMEAQGNVLVVSTDGRRLATQQLRYNQSSNQISSDSAFVLTQPGRTLTGVGFISDPNLNDIRVLHKPGGGGQFTLPGGTR